MAVRRPALAATGAAALVAAVLLSVAWWPSAQKQAAERVGASPSPTAPAPSSTPAPSTTSPSATPSPTAEPTLAWGPTVAEWDEAQRVARALPLEAAAGQVIVAAVGSPSPAAAEQLVSDLGLGGVIVMGDAVTDVDGVQALTAAAQAGAAQADGRDWQALVGVDQEGGTVARLRGLMPDLPSFMAAGAARDKDAVRSVYAQAAVDLRAMGFTLDFAPVADATVGLADPVIRARSAGDDASRVADTVAAASVGFVEGGTAPILKHFPGHGSVAQDSHQELPVQSASVAELQDRDLVPFAAGIASGAPAVMMAHIEVPEWGTGPATLAPSAYQHLREEMGFDGVAVTDALNMGAIQATHSAGEAAVAALAAGADMLLMPPDPREARDAIVAAVESGEVGRERLDEAAARLILLSRWQERLPDLADEGADYARELAAVGATVAAADCSGAFVGDRVTIRGGWEADRTALADALEAHGVTVGEGGTSIVLLGGDDASGTADVVVALGGPWGLSASDARVHVGLYGRSRSALAGLADVLVGEVPPGGDWPVAVDVPHPGCG